MSLIVPAFSQKIKYKDLFVLLNAKKYEEAEPFLRTFLNDSKNDDHANAHFQMAMIFHDKALTSDLLDETDLFYNNADSAIHYYNIAYNLIDDKELRKRDEYYQEYRRRDLRTGKFDIKLSDVQLDIEKRIENLETRKSRTQTLKRHFVKMQEFYEEADSIYRLFQSENENREELLLSSDEKEIQLLNRLEVGFDSAKMHYDSYKNVLDQIPESGYNHFLALKKIQDFKIDGSTLPDWKEDDLEFWDYKAWATDVKSIINDEIIPLKQEIIAFDDRLNELYDTVKNDSIAVNQEMDQLSSDELFSKLKKYDDDPLPVDLFNLKMKELEYLSFYMPLQKENLLDSANISYQLSLTNRLLDATNGANLLVNSMVTKNIADQNKRYSGLIRKNYGSIGGVQRYISSKALFFNDEKEKWENRISVLEERNNWGIHEGDSIPLFVKESYEFNTDQKGGNYLPFWVSDSIGPAGTVLSSGLASIDEIIQGYFVYADEQRNIPVIYHYPVDITAESLPMIRSFVAPGKENEYMIMVYSNTSNDDHYKSTIIKLSLSDGTVWDKNFDLPSTPVKIDYNQQIAIWSIHFNPVGAESESTVTGNDVMLINEKGEVLN